MDNPLTDVAGGIDDLYKLGDQYGSAAWDAIGGDFSGFAELGNVAGLYAINKTFGPAFGKQSTAAGLASQAGMTYGMTAAGPAGAIVLGAAGAMLGAGINSAFGNADVDYDFKTSSSDQGFQDGQFISTPFGNIGFNSGSTRNLSMNKMGNPILSAYAKILGPMDMQLASVLTEGEMGQVRSKMEGVIENAHKWGPEYSMKLMLKDRMSAIDNTLSPARKKETGWDETLASYNEQYAEADRSMGDRVMELQRAIDGGKSVTADTGIPNTQRMRKRRAEEAQQELEQLSASDPAVRAMLRGANSTSDDGAEWWKPTGLQYSVRKYYNRIDESNARLRV